jgi:hypothetical protein
LCAARPPRRASALSPPLPHPPEVVSDAVTHRVRTSVGLQARDVQTHALGACPQVRVLKPALVGEQRVVHLPERVLTRRRLGRRPPGRAKAGRRRCRDIDQVACRLRYRDLREAGVSEVPRQLPQFANLETCRAGGSPAAIADQRGVALCHELGCGVEHRRCSPKALADRLTCAGEQTPGAVALVTERAPATPPSSLLRRTKGSSACVGGDEMTATPGQATAR